MKKKKKAFISVMGGLQYWQKAKNFGPIAYWPLWDAAGSSTAIDLMGLGNGALGAGGAKPTMGVTGIGDGKTACSFDGGDYINIYSAALASAFSPTAGSLVLWGKVSAAGVWTDSATRRLIYLAVDASNYISINRTTTNNELACYYNAGGSLKGRLSTALNGTTDWFMIAMTWNTAADEVKVYFNGNQVGLTLTSIGTWSGSLASGTCIIGAQNAGPGNPWSGSEAHVALYAKTLTPSQIGRLANP